MSALKHYDTLLDLLKDGLERYDNIYNPKIVDMKKYQGFGRNNIINKNNNRDGDKNYYVVDHKKRTPKRNP